MLNERYLKLDERVFWMAVLFLSQRFLLKRRGEEVDARDVSVGKTSEYITNLGT